MSAGVRRIEAVLFDADGVLQRAPAHWLDTVGGLAALGDPDAFLAEVFAAERPCLAGRADLRDALAEVFARWSVTTRTEDAVALWNEIEIDVEVLGAVDALRGRGIACYLATNQHAYRAAHMTTVLGYATRFDDCFYSCELGHAKPSRAYFESVLAAIPHDAQRTLFIDDAETNVVAAREAGLHAAHLPAHSGLRALRAILSRYGLD
jgi:putative hydrolase of the HAD superfamily